MIQPKARLSPIGSACTIIKGTPYVDCGRCKVPVRLFDSQSQQIVIGYWKDEEEYLTNPHTDVITGVVVKRVLKTWTAPGCFDCHYLFNNRQASDKDLSKRTNKNIRTFFDIKECER